jgi:tRNA 2-selenouridine synthase
LAAIAVFCETLLDTHRIVDVRTPLEYEEDHIPGAVNVPLLSNEERVEIGIIHKINGPQAARVRGLELTASRFPRMVEEIASTTAGRPLLVYCWRGGLRSRTVTAILDLTGFPASQLQGGYKAYRAHVSTFFDTFRPRGPLVVLHGLTGVGKTDFLHRLDTQRYTVIDLEGLARHRGSAFGELGLTQDLSQKRFDSLLWDALRTSPDGRPIVVEGESRRIGRISLPGVFYDIMGAGTKIWCEASLETRVDRLIVEYGRPEYRKGMAAALQRIRKKLGGEKCDEILEYLERWDLRPFMSELLTSYYDRVYYKTRNWREDRVISLEDFDAAVRDLEGFLSQRTSPSV